MSNKNSRLEQYLNALATSNFTELPEPISRLDHYLKYICEKSQNVSSGTSMNQIVKMDVRGNEKITIPIDNGNDGIIINCYEYLESLETIITIMKQFNNSNSSNFYFNPKAVSFTGGMHIKNEHKLNMNLSSNGVYESEVININNFIGDIEIKVGGN